MLFKRFCVLIFKLKGWQLATDVLKEVPQTVMIAAPHTSNWDLIYTIAAFHLLNIPLHFTIKKEWIRFPFKRMIKSVGGIGIDRKPKQANQKKLSMVEAMANLFKENKKISIAVTPEGSRSLRTEWRTGFWHTALLAKVPIGLGYLDYATKTAGVGKLIYPTILENDMKEIMAFYKTKTPKIPEQFSVDLRYI